MRGVPHSPEGRKLRCGGDGEGHGDDSAFQVIQDALLVDQNRKPG